VGESLIAIEPMSCPANAFNTDIDAVVFQSGEKKTYAFSIKMS
jgi:galactose mutarotase-like enzyme